MLPNISYLRRARIPAILGMLALFTALCLTPTRGQTQADTTLAGVLPQTPAGLSVYAPEWLQPVSRSVPRQTPPDGVDLDVTFIQRTPAYHRYCLEYPEGKPVLCPGTEYEQRWPAPGEIVTFTAHIANHGTQPSPTFDYAWEVDGTIVATGTLPALAAQAETTTSYAWPWGHTMDGDRVLDDHTITFRADPNDGVVETYEWNNFVVDYTNAMSLNLRIPPAVLAAYATPIDPVFPFSGENWFQRQINAMNWALDNAVYAGAPFGAGLHVRIDTFVIGEIPPIPPVRDRHQDGYWDVSADYRLYSGGYDPVTDIDWNLVHELSHQIGLIDLYTFNVFDSTDKVTDQYGYPINFSDFWARPDLMGGGDIAPYTEWYRYSSHSARGALSTSGYRRGYYGEYQFDIPAQVIVQVLNNVGLPAADVQVTLYQRNGPVDWVGDIRVDDVPEISGVTDADGRFVLPNRPVNGSLTTATGHTLQDNPFGVVDVVGSRNRFMISLQRDVYQEFHWLDVTELNLAYWDGATDSYTLTFKMHLPAVGTPAAPHFTSARVQNFSQTLCWGYSGEMPLNVVGYNVYRIGPPEFAVYERVAANTPDSCYTRSTGDSALDYAVYAVTALDDEGRESGFSPLRWLPSLVYVTDVQRRADGNLLVLDRHFGRILLQQPDGRYVQPLNSPHFDLVGVDYFAVNQENQFYISSPNAYIQTASPDMQPGMAFGFNEFTNPRGIALPAAPSCEFGGPYAVDAHTLLLLHLNDSFTGAQGELPLLSPTATFAEGRFGSGVLVDETDQLMYAAAENLNRQAGAVEMWFRPNWAGNDEQNYVLFEAGNSWFNRLRIAKDGANYLRFMIWDDHTEYGAGFHVADWQPGEWHHIAVAWSGHLFQLYVDGIMRSQDNDANPPTMLPSQLAIGWSLYDGSRADGVIDELRISDIARLGNSDVCQSSIYVADAAGWVAEYNSSGYAMNVSYVLLQPEGVTIRPDGHILVVDRGDNLLKLFSPQLDWLGDISAHLNAPTHLTAYNNEYLVVADTGNNAVKVLYNNILFATFTAPNDGSGGELSSPLGVATLPSGAIVVADSGNQRVVQLRYVLPPMPQPVPTTLWIPISSNP